MAEDVLERATDIRRRVGTLKRVSLTDFARGKKWREELPFCDVIEVVDRTETAGFLVSPSAMKALTDAMDELEGQVERAGVQAMFEARSDYDSWAQGEDLAQAALASYAARREELKRVLDDGL